VSITTWCPFRGITLEAEWNVSQRRGASGLPDREPSWRCAADHEYLSDDLPWPLLDPVVADQPPHQWLRDLNPSPAQ